MPVDPLDARSDVRAPVERSLSLLIAVGAASFAAAVLAVVVTVIDLEGDLHLLAHLLLPALLLLAGVVRVIRSAVAQHADATGAWARARAVAPSDARLAAIVVAAVPIAWLGGGIAILVRHAADDAPAVISLYAPLFLVVWTLATIAWAMDCRDHLASALAESDRRFRSYWASVAERPD